MKSLRTFLIFIAIGSLSLITLIILFGQIILNKNLNESYEEQQVASLISIEQSLITFINGNLEDLSKILDAPNPEEASKLYSAFEDIYFIDDTHAITSIIKSHKNSRIFTGYQFKFGDFSEFLNDANENSAYNYALLRSSESDSVSIYLYKKHNDHHVVARINLARLATMLTAYADAFKGTLIIGNLNDYILLSSQMDIPFKIIPSTPEQIYSLNKQYILTTYESQALKAKFVLLTSSNRINSILNSILWILPTLLSCLVFFIIVQFSTIHLKVLKPIKSFVSELKSLNPSDIISEQSQTRTQLSEIADLHDAFYKKAQELKDVFEKINDERITAINHSIENEKFAALATLVAGVAHELNTPIGICITTTTFLNMKTLEIEKNFKSDQLSKSQLETFLYTLLDSHKVMSNTLDRSSLLIKSFKQLAVDQSTEPHLSFNMLDQIQLVVSSLKHELKKNHHEVTVSCPEDLTLTGYPSLYQQIFTNLIMNAMIHGFKEMPNGTIWINVSSEHHLLHLTVKDNGSGIPEEHRKKIFDPFFSTNRQGGGSGLGLNIVYNLVVGRLNGTIALGDNGHEGATFEMYIPIEND